MATETLTQLNEVFTSEQVARLREDDLHRYLAAVLGNARDNIEMALEGMDSDNGYAKAAQRALDNLEIAEGFVSELVQVGERPVSGGLVAH